MAAYKKYNKYKQKLFSNDLKALLCAYGDSSSPNADTIQALEDILISYLADIMTEANKARVLQKKNKLTVEDIMFALRKDPVKLGRAYDLKEMDRQITMAKKMFGDDEIDKKKGQKKDGNSTESKSRGKQ